MKKIAALLCLAISVTSAGQTLLTPSDIYRIQYVDAPEVSPDGKWVAYGLSTADSARDKYDENVWMAAVDGSGSVQLTYSPDDESSPKWSPDGKWLAFLSGRQKAKEKTQLWLLDRRGGEAKQLTSLNASISDYRWSPDGTRMVLVIRDQRIVVDSLKEMPSKPMVIDRYHFKEDESGYLESRYTHLYLLTIATGKLDTLTSGRFNNREPAWSPDGRYIAFTSNRSEDPDRNTNTDLWISEATPLAQPRKLTTWIDYDRHPVWSPDGKYIAYLRSSTPEWDAYDEPMLAIIPASGGEPKLLTPKLDRPINNPEWATDGKSVLGLVEDDRERYVMSFDAITGKGTRLSTGKQSITVVKPIDAMRSVVLMSQTNKIPEIYLLEKGVTKQITTHNERLVTSRHFASTEGFSFKNRDGDMVNGILYWPPGISTSAKPPLLIWIHGGPVAQDEYEFDMTVQILAANGYAVALINYRGSNGRGDAFARAIFGDWGNKEVVDLLDGTGYLVGTGRVDGNRLGIGGWSYGGILTDYVTATDPRFKAAASGAGSALQLSMYGTDQYIQQYEMEIGVPWKTPEKWIKISYPFFHADRIKTPTLYMVGEKDFNVPAAGSEQMYQALRSLGVPTQLIIYPDQHHGLMVPSYWIDRYVRYADWFKKYLH
jgi:dipeptidyl aminopeptidase/acylaminoacyl peptidase